MKYNVPPDMKSDGCSFPGILKLFKKLLGADKYKDYCVEHDFLRRYDVIDWFDANKLLAKRIAGEGLAGKLRCLFYLLFTTISYPWYSGTERLPDEYREYASTYNNKWK